MEMVRQGRDFTILDKVETDDIETLLYKDLSDNSFFIKDGSDYIPISEEWGGSAQLQHSYQWQGGSNSSIPIAVEKENGTDINSDGDSQGYFIAIKHSGTYDSQSYTDWQILYTNSKGVIDYNYMPWMQSIQSFEPEFGQDLDGDSFTGVNLDTLIAVSTDATGDLLKEDSAGSLYIVDDNGTSSDNSDDITVTITDEYGSSPYFDYSYSGGSGNYAYSYSSSAYAVESFVERGTKKYVLLIKSEDTYGGETSTFWETYNILIDPNDNTKGILDWATGNIFPVNR